MWKILHTNYLANDRLHNHSASNIYKKIWRFIIALIENSCQLVISLDLEKSLSQVWDFISSIGIFLLLIRNCHKQQDTNNTRYITIDETNAKHTRVLLIRTLVL